MSLNKTHYWKLILLLFLLAPLSLSAQTQVITGTVTEAATGEPLPGVTVVSKVTTIGAVTDFDGSYSIEIVPGATLVFSFVGFSPQEVRVKDQTLINVQLPGRLITNIFVISPRDCLCDKLQLNNVVISLLSHKLPLSILLWVYLPVYPV